MEATKEVSRLRKVEVEKMWEFNTWYMDHFGMDVRTEEEEDEEGNITVVEVEPYYLQKELDARYEQNKYILEQQLPLFHPDLKKAYDEYYKMLLPDYPNPSVDMGKETFSKIYGSPMRLIELEQEIFDNGDRPTPGFYAKFQKEQEKTLKKLTAYKKRGWIH
jgi:hypothetical protein